MAKSSAFRKLQSWHLIPLLHGNRWGTMETETDFIFLGSKIIEDSDYSYEIKRYMLIGRKDRTNLDSILKSRDIASSTMSIESKLWCFL